MEKLKGREEVKLAPSWSQSPEAPVPPGQTGTTAEHSHTARGSGNFSFGVFSTFSISKPAFHLQGEQIKGRSQLLACPAPACRRLLITFPC